jgi:hypothetical protein
MCPALRASAGAYPLMDLGECERERRALASTVTRHFAYGRFAAPDIRSRRNLVKVPLAPATNWHAAMHSSCSRDPRRGKEAGIQMQVSMKVKVAAASGLSLLMAASLGLSAGTANAAVAGTHAQFTSAKVSSLALEPEPSPWIVASNPEPSPWIVASDPEPSPWIVASNPQPSPWVLLSDPEPSPWLLKGPQPSPWVIL